MLVGSFLSGTVPMAFKLSDSKSKLLALMGSGILVGTALAIIIPEGIDSIYSKHDQVSLKMTQKNPPLSHNSNNVHMKQNYNIKVDSGLAQEPVQLWIIGLSLVVGFVLMLLIDQFSLRQGSYHNNSNITISTPSCSRHGYSLANQEEEDDNADNNSMDDNLEKLERNNETKPIKVSMRGIESNLSDNRTTIDINNHANRATPTLGLVIHASADGIALGAAATTSHRDVEMIIFLAIMLHKAPAAFSLVVFLMHKGLKHSTIRRHLLAFSLSAPLAAIITYFGLSQSGKEALRKNNATGIAMLFSAGTFLYVATVHILPELVHNKLLSKRELLFLVGGAFLPILLAQLI